MPDALLGEGVRVLVLGSGTIGHEVNALGVVEALGAPFELRRVAPRALFARLETYGPIDPRDKPGVAGSIFQNPLPDVAIASGHVTVPYMRALKQAGGRRVFAIFLQDPRHARSEMDLISATKNTIPYRGANVVTTLTSPHPFSPARIAAPRAAPDRRLASLPGPRCAVVLGGPNGAQHFTRADGGRMAEAIRTIGAQGFSVWRPLRAARRQSSSRRFVLDSGAAPGFVWDGLGENPYLALLALADAVLVTGDSANMVGEATATGSPVHIFEPSGGGSKKRLGRSTRSCGSAQREGLRGGSSG